jgi:hypothetical protein
MVALMFLGVVQQTLAQSAQDQLVGTWKLGSIYIEGPDGSRFDPFGANPTGILIVDGNGRISVQFIGSDLPKFVPRLSGWHPGGEQSCCAGKPLTQPRDVPAPHGDLDLPFNFSKPILPPIFPKSRAVLEECDPIG